MKFTDTVMARAVKPTRKEGVNRYAFKMTKLKDEKGVNAWISTFDDELGREIIKGEEYDFECEESEGFINLVSAMRVIRPEKPEEEKEEKKKKDWHAFGDKSYQEHKDDLIIRQVCLKEARAALEALPFTSSDDDLSGYAVAVNKLTRAFYKILTNNDWD